ncbi:RnfH family protein [Acidiferrobacter sp.]|uniref:RnfH family protein n=1 Tax=Acidiferrobacter sp. TaxID=1872107 RepID=UPI0026163CBC|nr:RnfH family protein [Acidiferrobacter sp.]
MARADWPIEVVYATPVPDVRWVHLTPGGSVFDAIRQSGLLEDYPGLDIRARRVGLFGRFATLSDPVRPFDRVEIYAPLPEDPKVSRRRRAAVTSGTSRRYSPG